MEMEKLNKSQIILLTLLTSFVTSIATGIVTVSLMDQAPPAIAQTVNRIVERTVEKMVPSVQTAAVGQTKTVVIKESDLIVQSLEVVRPSIVRLYSSDAAEPTFLGLGIVLTKTGTILADTGALGDMADAVVEQSGGQHVRVFVTRRDDVRGFAYLLAATTTTEGKVAQWMPAILSTNAISLGETIFAISGKTVARVGNGIVTALSPNDAGPMVIDTNIAVDSVMRGSPLVDIDGKIAGISTIVARGVSTSGFVPASQISLVPKAPDLKQ